MGEDGLGKGGEGSKATFETRLDYYGRRAGERYKYYNGGATSDHGRVSIKEKE